MATDDDLLRHYLARGGPDAHWNLLAEAAYVDYRIRDFLERHATRTAPMEVANLGIGVGLWDDFLGYWLGATGQLTSIDIDPAIVDVFAHRQAREGHPYPARAVCADLRAVTGAYDLITMVGSTAHETGDAAGAIAHAFGLVRPAGQLLLAGFDELVPLGAVERWLAELDVEDLIVDDDRRFPGLAFHLVLATRADVL